MLFLHGLQFFQNLSGRGLIDQEAREYITGLAIGGLIVNVSETAGLDRVMALRMPYFFATACLFFLFLWAAPQLTTEKIETARAEGIAAKEEATAVAEASDDDAPAEDSPAPDSD